MAVRGAKAAKPNSVNTERTKTSISLLPRAKYRLASIKAELRLKGHNVSESHIMEALLLGTDTDAVARLLRLR